MKLIDHKSLDFNEFKTTTHRQWEEKASSDLRGQPLTSIDWQSTAFDQNLTISPYYNREDMAGLEYLQKYHMRQSESKGWTTFFEVTELDKDLEGRLQQIKDLGCNSITTSIKAVDDIPKILPLLKSPGFEFALECFNIKAVLEFLMKLKKLDGSIPNIKYIYSLSEKLELNLYSDLYSGGKFLGLTSFSDKIDLQLLEYLTRTNSIFYELADPGRLAKVASQIFIISQTGDDYFLEIAKLRAARILLQALFKAHELEDSLIDRLEIFSISGYYENSQYQPHENMIKSSYSAMSAIIGGCNSLLIKSGLSNPLSENTALQLSNLLRHESHLDKVSDPAAGSYYIENITHQLVMKVWDRFAENQK